MSRITWSGEEKDPADEVGLANEEGLTEEELLIAVRAFVEPPYTSCGDGPPCLFLLTRPADVLQDQSRWPDHICGELMEASCREWVSGQTFRVFGSQTSWRWYDESAEPLEGIVPVPIGRRSVAAYKARPELERLAVFHADELATLILHERIGDTRITAYGLVSPPQGESEVTFFKIIDMRFDVVGDPLDREVVRFCRQARSWWRTLGHISIPSGGRSRIEIPYELACEEWVSLYSTYPDLPQTFATFVPHLQERLGRAFDNKTFQRRVREWKAEEKPFPPPV